MVSIILVVISIALLASVAAVSMNHIPVDAYLRQQMMKEAEAGIQMASNGVGRYLNSHRDTSGNIIYPGDGVNLAPLYAPNYGFLPQDIRKELTWEVTAAKLSPDLPAAAICLRPVSTSSALQQDVLERLRAQLPVGSAYVNTGCNATSNVVGGTHLTYWLPISHIN